MGTISKSELNEMIRTQLESVTGDISKNISDELKKVFDKPLGNKLSGTWPGDSDSEPKFKTGYAKKARELFGESSETKGFNSLGECLQAIRHNDFNKLQHLEKSTMTEGEGASGGFFLPSQFSNDVINLMLEQEICRPRCRVYSLKRGQGNSLTIPAVKDYDHSSDGIAGIKTYWKAEGATYTESTPTIRQISLKVNKLTCLVDVTEELLEDSAVSTENLLGGIFAQALGFEIDSNVLTNAGTGAGRPLSVTNGGSMINVAGEIGQVADSIQYENVCNMAMRILPSSFSRSIWLSSLSNIKQLLLLNMKIGTAGSHIQIFTEANGVWKILGRPVIFTEHCAVLGDAGNLKLVDLSRYAMLLKEGILVRSDSSLGFKKDVISFKASIRIDSSPLDNSVTTLKDSVTTVSPFIQLDSI